MTRGACRLVLSGGLAVALGCAALRPAPLDLLPGQRVVLGRIDVSRLEASEAVVEIVKEDGSYWQDLRVSASPQEFVVGLPPGRYRVARVRLLVDRPGSPNNTVWRLGVAFEVGDAPAVYVGTLRLVSRLAAEPVVRVDDEYADTVRAVRAHYTEIPAPVARVLMTPG